MRPSTRRPAATSRLLVIVLAVGLLGLLGTVATLVLAASAWDMDGMMDDHMARMMGGGRDATGDPSSQGAATNTITIEDFAFSAGNLRVPAGAAVTWINRDSAPHSATASDGAWDTGILSKGESATITFSNAGTFDYYCTVHPNMKARLVVE